MFDSILNRITEVKKTYEKLDSIWIDGRERNVMK